MDDQWYMPFFFGDAKRVFYVTQSEETILFRTYAGLRAVQRGR